jgi:HSP90 family molecular chaperone
MPYTRKAWANFSVSKELYSDPSHFILELLQNLDDTAYAEGVQPAVSFKLRNRKLVVESNQIGFTEKDVDAICSLGESSKVPEAGVIKETTGEKGIGCFVVDPLN